MKQPIKIRLTKSQEELFQEVAQNANSKWFYFPKVYKRIEDRVYEEMDLNDIPEGIKKYINENK